MKCKQCKAKCCSIFVIHVDIDDVIRISKYLKLSIDQFIGRFISKNKLKYKKLNNEDYCIFIDPDTYLCMIHKVKPKICNEFKCQRWEE